MLDDDDSSSSEESSEESIDSSSTTEESIRAQVVAQENAAREVFDDFASTLDFGNTEYWER